MDDLMRTAEVLAATRLPRSSLYDRMNRGTFPRGCKIHRRLIVWKRSEVEAWIEAQFAKVEGEG